MIYGKVKEQKPVRLVVDLNYMAYAFFFSYMPKLALALAGAWWRNFVFKFFIR